MRITLVGCGASKRDEPSEARELYTSTYFRLKREWAEENSVRWFVLSAKHGIVEPDTVIEPYDVTVSDECHDTQEWANKVDSQLEFVGWRNVDEVVVLAGSSYTQPLSDVFSRYDREFSFPLSGMGIGEQQSWLSDGVDG